jgi:ribosomal protein L11 methyltransferase
MRWQQLTIFASNKTPEELSDILFGLGSVSVSFEDAGDEPLFEVELHEQLLWRETKIIAIFEEDVNPIEFLMLLKKVLNDDNLKATWDEVPDKDWVTAWKDQFTAIHFGNDLWICPSWLIPENPNAINIILDPGMAFGTGTHSTTALMLEYLSAHPPKDLSVIDYGCGSGILAMAAAKLGATHVMGVDNDPNAVRVTLENAQINHISKTKLEACLNTELVSEPVHLVLANILALPLVELAPTLTSLVKPGGQLILSGILANEQVELIIKTYADHFELKDHAERKGWVRLVLNRL